MCVCVFFFESGVHTFGVSDTKEPTKLGDTGTT